MRSELLFYLGCYQLSLFFQKTCFLCRMNVFFPYGSLNCSCLCHCLWVLNFNHSFLACIHLISHRSLDGLILMILLFHMSSLAPLFQKFFLFLEEDRCFIHDAYMNFVENHSILIEFFAAACPQAEHFCHKNKLYSDFIYRLNPLNIRHLFFNHSYRLILKHFHSYLISMVN